MAGKHRLFDRVERLLIGLLDEAETVTPAKFDDDGIELVPAKTGATFGERLKLAEVATTFETRRAKVVEDNAPSVLQEMMGDFHNADRKTPGRRGRKARAPESDGIAANGRALGAFTDTPAAGHP